MCWSLLFPCPKCQKKAAKRRKAKAKAKAEASAKLEAKLTEVLDNYSVHKKESTRLPSRYSTHVEDRPLLNQEPEAWSWKSWTLPSSSRHHDPTEDQDLRRKSPDPVHKILHDPSKCTCPCRNCTTGCWKRFKHDSHHSPIPTAWTNIESWSRASFPPRSLPKWPTQKPQPSESRHRPRSTRNTWSSSRPSGSSQISTTYNHHIAREDSECQGDYPLIYIYPRSSPATSFPVVDYTKTRNQGSDDGAPYLAYAVIPTSAPIADLAAALAPVGSGLKLRARCATGRLKRLRDFDNLAELRIGILQLEVWDAASEKRLALRSNGKKEPSKQGRGVSGSKGADAMRNAWSSSAGTDGQSTFATAYSSKTRARRRGS